MRYAILMALILSVSAALAIPQDTAHRKIPCKTPEIAPMCYWTRGRLNFYNGNPSYRIWKVGTKRILGVYSGPAAFPPRTNEDSENPAFPANLDDVFEAEITRNERAKQTAPYLIGPVFADFEVCPLEPDVPGEMQAVCIESARDIFVEMSKRGYR